MNDSHESGPGGCLSQTAATMLREVALPDKRPVLCLIYNVMPDPPGRPAYTVVPTDPEMWDCAPHVTDALQMLAQVTRHRPIVRPPGSLPAPLTQIPVDRRPGRRLDGLALLYRAWSLDSSTPAGLAMMANVTEGYYRFGDIAASPQRRDIRTVGAVDRNGACAALFRDPDGPVQDASTRLGQPGSAVTIAGAIMHGQEELLHALWDRFGAPVRA